MPFVLTLTGIVRRLCLSVREQLFLPGDTVIDIGESNARVFYIVKASFLGLFARSVCVCVCVCVYVCVYVCGCLCVCVCRGVRKGGQGGHCDPLASDSKWCQTVNLQEKTRKKEEKKGNQNIKK